MKPTNVTKNDEAYRTFLKKVRKIKKKQDFLARGLTVQELETCVKHAYRSLSKQRLKGYNSYVHNRKSKIYEEIEQMEKFGENSVEAPDNSEKTEQFNKVVCTIRELSKTEEFESVMNKPALIAEQLFSKKKAKSKIAFVKKFLKHNYAEIKERSEAHEEERNDDISNYTDQSENMLAKRFEDMSTEDQKSDHVEDIAKGLKDETSGGETHDSGIVTNQTSNGNAEASPENKQSYGEDHQPPDTEQNKILSVSSVITQASNGDNDELAALTNIKAKLSTSAKRRLSSDVNACNRTSIGEDLTTNRQDRKRFRSASMPVLSDFLFKPARTNLPSFNEENIVAVDDNVFSAPANIEDDCGGNSKRNIFSKRFYNTITIMELDSNSIKTTENNSDHTENSNDLINVDEETTFEDNNIDFHDNSPAASSQTDTESNKYESANSGEFHDFNGNSDVKDSISSPCSFKTALTSVDVVTVEGRSNYLSSNKESSSSDDELNFELEKK